MAIPTLGPKIPTSKPSKPGQGNGFYSSAPGFALAHSSPGFRQASNSYKTAHPLGKLSGSFSVPSAFTDPSYLQTEAGLIRRKKHLQDDLLYSVGELNRQYGVNSQGQLAADPSNPYSLASVLQHTYNNTTKGTTNRYAGMGQLYSGAYQNARGTDANTYGRQYNQLAEGYNQGKRSAISSYQSGLENLSDAQVAAAQAAVNNAISRGVPLEDAWAQVYGTAPPQQGGGKGKGKGQKGPTWSQKVVASATRRPVQDITPYGTVRPYANNPLYKAGKGRRG